MYLLCRINTCPSLNYYLVDVRSDLVIRQFGYFKVKNNVDDLIEGADDLKVKKKDIQERIGADERNRKKPTNEVERWIKKVNDIEGEVTKVRSDYDQRGQCCWPNCCSNYKIGRRASKLLIKLNALKKEGADFNVLTIDAPPASVEQMSSTSNAVGNMITFNKEKICGYLKEQETDGVIGIWGMGGVGKTTLLEAINDNFLSNNGNSVTNKLFDHVIFIIVSKEHQLENLQKVIAKKLGLRETEDLVLHVQIISEYLKEKNFLLLFDDIWEVVQLKDLGIPDPRSSSERRFRRKMVFTTRSLQVCVGMKCHKKIEVECLEEVEAWDLFKKNVGEGTINLPDIRSLAEKVARECGGLPLALVVIGQAMATKESLGEWNYALKQLRNAQPSNIPGMEMEENYFLRLKFSYDSLRDDKMRKCFLRCSLWPEDYKIIKNELIMCWMGLGLIDGFEDINEAYDEGDSLIGSLIIASLLQPVQDRDDVIKVHDVIRDLALWIACDSGTNRNRWLVKAGVGLEEVPDWGGAKRVSLMNNKIQELPPHLLTCRNLSTLILQRNEFTLIPRSFFTCMPNLTYLDLSCNWGLREIPKEICCLIQLRYLNLSNTKISSLPEELGQLKSLKHLLLQYTPIGEVIRGIIGRLLELKYLDLFPFGSVETNELLRLSLLKGVGMKTTSEHALQQLSCVPILHLNIEDMGGDSSTTSIHLHNLLSSCTKLLSLRKLRFTECHSIRELVVDVDVHLPRLESLNLDELENLTEIVWRSVVPPSECFQRLRYLEIICCHGLKDITWVLHLPCLECLVLHKCKEMEQLVVIGGGGEEEREKVTKPTFPRLKRLFLLGLPKLAMICDNHDAAATAAVNFPSLEVLVVRKCKELKRLPFHPQLLNNNNCSKLKNIYGHREWWEGIEWGDQSAQSSLLQPYFHAL